MGGDFGERKWMEETKKEMKIKGLLPFFFCLFVCLFVCFEFWEGRGWQNLDHNKRTIT